jgi:MYXO-CTERM domain-containing protein
LKVTLIAATLLLSITSAQAGFLNTDWETTGDSKATLHEETGLEWLDVSETFDKSHNTVVSELDTTYSGWRLPSVDELGAMMSSYIESVTGDQVDAPYGSYAKTSTSSNLFDVARSRFGGSLCSVSGSYCSTYDRNATRTRGQVMGVAYNPDFAAEGGHEYAKVGITFTRHNIYDQPSYTEHTYFRNGQQSASASNAWWGSGTKVGVWLVSDGGTTLSSQSDPAMNANNAAAPINEVSAPALLGLMGLGLFGFAARRRNAK